MRDSTLEFLYGALTQTKLEDKYDVFELYKLYSAVEIDSYDRIIDATNEFFDFLKSILPYTESRQAKCAVESAEKNICSEVSKLSRNTFEKIFAKIILELSPTKPENSHILDVGPSEMPVSSLVLGQETKTVSAMDKEFIFAIESLKNLNVNAMETYFDENTPVDDYDFVVGRCPCSAIGHIVAMCAKQNKPYFLELCNCNVPNRKKYILDKNGQETHTWKNVLPDIDPNVKFFEEYAFNLDASPEQVRKVIDKIDESRILPDKYNVKSKKLYLDLENMSFFKSVTPDNSEEELSSFDWD